MNNAYQNMEDWELVAAAQAADMAAFTVLVERYQQPVLHFCERMIGGHQEAEELAQESFLRLYRYLLRLKPKKAKFTTMLFGMTRNIVLNYLRDEKRRGRGRSTSLDDKPLATSEKANPDVSAKRSELRDALERAIAALTPEHREVILLREMEGMDYDAIAKVVGCRKGTVRSRLARAREQMRLFLLEEGGDWL